MHAPKRTLLAIATAYVLTGWIALQFLVPDGYVAPVYPPAGIALGALILYGWRMWPAILVGALITNVVATAHAGGEPGFAVLVSALGATLQALFGAWLAHRLLCFADPLDTPRSIARLLFVVAPVSSLVNASLSVPVLAALGTVAPDEQAFNWLTWWLGDTLGALIALPLMFVFLAQPADLWRPRRAAVAVPLLIVGLLTALAFDRLQRAENLRVETQFERESEHLATLVAKRLDNQIDMLIAIERFAALQPRITREGFRSFVVPLLARHAGTQNFTWNPLVTHEKRAPFEDRVWRTDLAGFRILERDDSAPERTRAAQARSQYLPILYVEPLDDNLAVLGLDPLAIELPARAISETRSRAVPVATEGFVLTQERAAQRGVVLYQAVYGRTELDANARQLRGIVSSAFRMDDALGAALTELPDRRMQLCLVDLAAAQGNRRLSGPEGCERAGWSARTLARNIAIPFAERPWEVRLRAAPGYAEDLRTLTAWAAIIVGVIAAGVLAAFLLMTSGHARRVERLVVQRTRELADASEGLRAQGAALMRAQQIARMGSFEFDTATATLQCSDGLRHLLALPARPELAYADLLDALDATDRPLVDRAVSAARNGGQGITLDCRPMCAPATTLQFVVECENPGGPDERIVGTAQDVTVARQAEADIQQLAHYDALTGLPNRMLWGIRAQAALQGARRHEDALAVLFIDLDHFKTVNDSLGHRSGDALLQSVASRLAGCIRDEDFLARIGGDEFVVLLPRLHDQNDADTVARKMLASMGTPIEIEGHLLQPSMSIGIALFPADGTDADTLLKHADTAMYAAKSAGRNTMRRFVESMNVQAFERLTIENGLRRAIERGEISLHYQPQFDAIDDRAVGVEALARWTSPQLGVVPPDRFIPVAEESGMIHALGELVLLQACQLQRRWQNGPNAHLLVAVNISALQFTGQDFVASVAAILHETGADARRIELEITETALMGHGPEQLERLERLRALGLTLALDDFGTGYSSLGRLNRLPITRLKLDRSFVQHLPSDADSAAIANATLSMARALKLEVIAEGIETEAQKAYLFARGCRLMQGYLYSRPLPEEALEAFLAEAAQRAAADEHI
ncbi:EAL domain-containing protein [Pseudazoarcus pumilus]|uniref:Diguanylate cyclase n=1 Tax=Pseudazoarcus pumilus TaxID=2067960 RepID=A0A2I6S7Q4_9RHOO|nr:EAL domain-containing protein [Pseudazoarcus pumilus]AUN95268.1 diguanylate cyclase [Pseudazoarcus pumilus]